MPTFAAQPPVAQIGGCLPNDDAERLVLRLDVVREAERDRQHALALVVVHLLQREVLERAFPELVHRADAVAEGGHEDIAVSHCGEAPVWGMMTRSRVTLNGP